MLEPINPQLIANAKEKLKSGKSKQETFEELVNEFDVDSIKIAKIIRFIPTEEKRKKYFPLSILTSTLLLIIIIVETYILIKNGGEIDKQFVISSIVSIIIIIGMLKSNAAFYSGAGFFGAARLFIIGLHVYLGGVPVNKMILFELTFSTAILILGFYLRTTLDSRYTVESEPQVIDSTRGISFPD